MAKANQKATETKDDEVVNGETNLEVNAELNTEEKTEVNEEQKATETPIDPNVPTFSKEQIMGSKWFTHRRDILGVLLKDEQEYSHAEVDKILGEFLKGKVK